MLGIGSNLVCTNDFGYPGDESNMSNGFWVIDTDIDEHLGHLWFQTIYSVLS